jgi:osmotically-inducible protein OsmY
MKLPRALALSLVAALAAAQLSGCSTSASGGSSRTTGQAADDAALTAKVKAKIAAEAGLKDAAKIDVTTNRGVVQLSGFVESLDELKRAAEAARKVEGVQQVRNDLIIAPGARG